MKKYKPPKISIIIPIYNVEKYLFQCLKSIASQSLQDIEIICVNDGSTDGSLDIIKEFASKDRRFVVLSDKNQGYGHAVNSGIEKATGKYIGIVESDDFVLEEMYETLYEHAFCEGQWLDMVKSDAIRFYGDGLEGDCKIIPVTKPELYDRVLNPEEEPECFNAYLINTTGIYKRSLFDKYAIRLNESRGAAYQDNGLWFQLFANAKTIKFVNQAFYMYRQDREDSSTNIVSYENAMAIFGEWDYIYNLMQSYPEEIRNTCRAMYCLRCYGSYYYHFTRVKLEYKLIFLQKFSEDMQKLMQDGNMDLTLFKGYQITDLNYIISNPEDFYYSWISKNRWIHEDEKCKKIRSEIDGLLCRYEMFRQWTAERSDQPFISIIIPVYNAEKYIAECLNSVLSQSIKEIEVVCIDDGSTDHSLDILTMYMKTDARVIVRTQNNQGAGAARNTALEIASGEYIAFMDPDDYYPDSKALALLYKKAKKADVDICGGNVEMHENGIASYSQDLYFEEEKVMWYSEWQMDYGYANFIYKRAFLQNENIRFPLYRRFQDPPFFIKVMIAAEKFLAIPDVVYAYRYQHNHVSWTLEKIEDIVKGITECIHLSRINRLSKLHYNSVMRLEKSYSERILKFGNNVSVLRLLVIAEHEIDIELFNEANGEITRTSNELQLVERLLQRMKKENQPPLKGYIGPNGLQQRMQLKNDCMEMKARIIETTMSNAYRAGRLLSKIWGRKRRYMFDMKEVRDLGNSNETIPLQREKVRLQEILSNIYKSSQFKIGIRIAAFLGRKG